MKLLKEIWDYRTMISSLVKRDLRGRYKGSVLGFLWTFLNPLLQVLRITQVFIQELTGMEEARGSCIRYTPFFVQNTVAPVV